METKQEICHFSVLSMIIEFFFCKICSDFYIILKIVEFEPVEVGEFNMTEMEN